MLRTWIFAGIFLAAGIVLLVVPIHMQMTGVVLCMLGAAIMLCGLLHRRKGKKTRAFRQILTIMAASGVVILMTCMNIITTSGHSDWNRAEQSDYAVVLGAAVKSDSTASRIMRNRLSAALEFMERNPKAVVIVSGGQGPDEPISEAQCMYETLLEMGAEKDRLLMEEESHTTRENLMNSRRIIQARGGTERPVTIITSEFHQRRAAFIGNSLDLDTCPVSGRTDQWFYRVNYTLREVFAFVKAAFQSSAD